MHYCTLQAWIFLYPLELENLPDDHMDVRQSSIAETEREGGDARRFSVSRPLKPLTPT